jgi:hypothetical protein
MESGGCRVAGAFLLQEFVCLFGGYTSLAVFVARKRRMISWVASEGIECTSRMSEAFGMCRAGPDRWLSVRAVSAGL